MKTVKNILQSKSHDIYHVGPGSSVFEGLQLMMEKNISALLIVENEELKGIFTERDYARKIILQGKSSKDTQMSEVMTAGPITVSAEDSIEKCMSLMTERHIRHLPVTDNGKLAGMVSIGDVVKTIINEQKETIQQLEQYISS